MTPMIIREAFVTIRTSYFIFQELTTNEPARAGQRTKLDGVSFVTEKHKMIVKRSGEFVYEGSAVLVVSKSKDYHDG
jgi:hypothetical protein